MEQSLSCGTRGLPGLPVLLLGGFVTVFDLFVVNVAAPVIQRQFAADFSGVGLIVAGYELAFGVLLIAGGRLGDRFGRRRMFSLGMLGFALTSALCGAASSLGMLIVARFLQGAAAALLFPQIYALLRVLYNPHQRRRAFAWLGMTLGLAAIFGQILGGFIIEANVFGSGWRMIFLINLPIGGLALLAARRLPESRLPQAQRLDGVGLLLAASGLLLLLVPLLEGPSRGWPQWVWPTLALAAPTLWGFIRWERRLAQRSGDAVLDPALFRQGHFAHGVAVVLAIYSTASSFFLCFALLLQAGVGLTPFQAGSLFAPASLAFMLASMLAPRLAQRWGDQVLATGVAVYAAGLALLVAQVLWGAALVHPLRLLPGLVALGFGQALSMTPLLNLVLGLAHERQAGMAAGLVSTVQQVGGALGIVASGAFFVPLLAGGGGAERYGQAFAGAMFYNLLAMAIAFVLLKWIIRQRHKVDLQ
ncbi:Spectinomycin tetracycline efflux pump [Serratia ficaria]|uniref:MFS transporter n=1 Tax=Serratia ficaria TaxID=61651 RepID=UPI0021792C4C|nr:MFS transporter [Serratia ficaria]CAI2135047.1 Spectinomycin tetracycline efflux pump [Serratia ficaria]CAI2413400.1 Spectinomycin tetracycline efflux pump [Serratia ficaria]